MVDPAPPSVPPAPAAPARKSMGVFPKILIGCAGLLVVLGLVASLAVWWGARKLRGMAAGAEKNPAAFAAKLMTAGNPELEVVSQDDDRRTVTIRNKKTGESLTVNAAELEKGKLAFRNEKGEQLTVEGSGDGGKGGLTVTSKDGTTTVGSGAGALPTPDWVPAYPGVKPVGAMAKKGPEGEDGMFSFQTADEVGKVLGHYEGKLKGAGYQVERTTTEGQAGAAGSLTAKHEGAARSVSVTAVTAEGGTQVTVVYESRKP
jgi:hypothetical protein